jgi:hypothetical protein
MRIRLISDLGKNLNERVALDQQIVPTDRQIDQLVYELCALTDSAIKIVEDATRG